MKGCLSQRPRLRPSACPSSSALPSSPSRWAAPLPVMPCPRPRRRRGRRWLLAPAGPAPGRRRARVARCCCRRWRLDARAAPPLRASPASCCLARAFPPPPRAPAALRAARAAPRHRRTVRWRRGGLRHRGGAPALGGVSVPPGQSRGEDRGAEFPAWLGKGPTAARRAGRGEAAVPSRCSGTARRRRGAGITGGAAAAALAGRRERGGCSPPAPPGQPCRGTGGRPRPPRRRGSRGREPAPLGRGSERGSGRPLPATPRSRIGAGRAAAAPSRSRRCPDAVRSGAGGDVPVRSGALAVLGALPARSGSAVRLLLPLSCLSVSRAASALVSGDRTIERLFCFPSELLNFSIFMSLTSSRVSCVLHAFMFSFALLFCFFLFSTLRQWQPDCSLSLVFRLGIKILGSFSSLKVYAVIYLGVLFAVFSVRKELRKMYRTVLEVCRCLLLLLLFLIS